MEKEKGGFMIKILISIFLLSPLYSYCAQENEDPFEVNNSTQAYIEDDSEAVAELSKEDIQNFVEDYIKKDVQLKGYFFIEDKENGKILRLKLSQIKEVIENENGKQVIAEFKDNNSKLFYVIFTVAGSNFGNLDITKVYLKSEARDKKNSSNSNRKIQKK
jgi:hypothetical protein